MKVFIFLLTPILSAQTSNVANYSSETNDRFADSSQFVGSHLNFSGVGRTTNGQWATLIAPNIFVTANHFGPRAGREVTFFAENDPSGESFSYQVAGTSRIGGSDLLIGHFDEAVDRSLNYYGWQSEELDESSFADSSLFDAEILQLTRSDEFGNLTDLVVGQNVIHSFLPDAFISTLGGGDLLTTRYSLTDTDVQYHEAVLVRGDSGSPLFSVAGSELSVVGIASATSGTSSFFTYTGTAVDEVDSYIEVNGLSVPEPSSGLLLGLSLFGLWKRRR